MQLHIDESGNLGKSGNFFVIASLIPTPLNPRRIKGVFRKSCIKYGNKNKPLEEIKAFNLTFPQKQDLLKRLCIKDDFSVSYIVAEKKYLEPKILVDKNICYNYLASHLFKRIIKGASEDIQVILDNHSIKVKSLNSLADYIKIEAYTKWGFKNKITFEYQDSKSRYVLQAVDTASNIIYGRYEHNKKHLFQMMESFFRHRIEFPYQKFSLDINSQ